MVFSKVGPNQSIEWGQIRVSKSTVRRFETAPGKQAQNHALPTTYASAHLNRGA